MNIVNHARFLSMLLLRLHSIRATITPSMWSYCSLQQAKHKALLWRELQTGCCFASSVSQCHIRVQWNGSRHRGSCLTLNLIKCFDLPDDWPSRKFYSREMDGSKVSDLITSSECIVSFGTRPRTLQAPDRSYPRKFFRHGMVAGPMTYFDVAGIADASFWEVQSSSWKFIVGFKEFACLTRKELWFGRVFNTRCHQKGHQIMQSFYS